MWLLVKTLTVYIILVSGLLAQLNKYQNLNPRVLVSNLMWDWLYVLNIFCIWEYMIYTYIVNIYHTTHHPMQFCLIRNSKFQRFTTVQQTLSNRTHKSSLLSELVPRTTNSCTHWYIYTNIYIYIYIYIKTYIYIYMHWGISLPSKTLALSLFCQAPYKSENFQSPPSPSLSSLAYLSLYILFFCQAL